MALPIPPELSPRGPERRARSRGAGGKNRWVRQLAGLLALVVIGGGIVIGALVFGAFALVHAISGSPSAVQARGIATSAPAPSPSVQGTPPPSTPSTAPSGPAVSGPLALSSVQVFDPVGSEAAHYPHLQIGPDGTLTPTYRSQIYATAGFGNLKPGVGLLLDLGADRTLHQVQLSSTTPGATVQIRVAAAPQPAATGYRQLAQASTTAGPVSIPVTAATADRYLLVWFTTLGTGPSGAQLVIDHLQVS